MMRTVWAPLVIAGTLTVTLVGQSGDGGVIYAGQAAVAEAYGQGGGIVVAYGAIASVPGMRIAAGHREPGRAYNVEYHEAETETYYMIEGGGVVVTGGRIAEDNTGITGGERHRLAAGDVLVIPPQTPHWWEEVAAPTNYLTVSIRQP